MERNEKVDFVLGHIQTIQRKVLNNIDKLPENWEGLEIKQYIADSFQIEKTWFTRTRKANYNNDVIVNNL